jgi:hypothetical protein
MTPSISIIRHHFSLEVRCLDRVYLHAYIPKLRRPAVCATSSTTITAIPCHLPLFKPRHDPSSPRRAFSTRHGIRSSREYERDAPLASAPIRPAKGS